jgi:hypothetical protein
VWRASRAVVETSGLPRAGTSELVPLKIKEFLVSVELLAWAKENSFHGLARTRAVMALIGHLQVLGRATASSTALGMNRRAQRS